MKVKRFFVVSSFLGIAATCALGQLNCPDGSIRLPLACELPLNSSNLTPSKAPGAIAAAKTSATSINAAIGTQLTQLLIPSGTSGTITLKDKNNPEGTDYFNLGPILTDRPDLVGKKHLYAGFSYQHFNFNAIDGNGLGGIGFGYVSQPITKEPPNSLYSLTYYGSSKNAIRFSLDQYVALLTYGATKTTDVSLILPFNSVSLAASSSSFKEYTYDSQADKYLSPNSYNVTVSSFGTASGLGDITLGVKQALYGGEDHKTAISAGFTVRLPTGDALNYLGSGAYGANAYGIFSYRARISPHAKLANQWNGPSILVNPTADTHGDKRLPGGIQYAVGLDASVNSSITVSTDILGSQFVNTTSLTLKNPIALNPVPSAVNSEGTPPPTNLAVVTPINNTYTTVNFSGGVKWRPSKFPKLLLYGNVLVQLNNVGLRSDPVPLGGISYNFNLNRK